MPRTLALAWLVSLTSFVVVGIYRTHTAPCVMPITTTPVSAILQGDIL